MDLEAALFAPPAKNGNLDLDQITAALQARLLSDLSGHLNAETDKTQAVTDVVRGLQAAVEALTVMTRQMLSGVQVLANTQENLARYIAQSVPPVVNVDAPHVHMDPSEPTVHVTVDERPTVKRVERDKSGLIVRIVEEVA